MTIWLIRISCWITKGTHALPICNTYSFSSATVVARTRPSVTFIRALPVLFYSLTSEGQGECFLLQRLAVHGNTCVSVLPFVVKA